jgi:hypothetical protein
MTRAALLRLIERWPEAVPFADLHHAAHRALGAAGGFAVGEELESRTLLANEILQLYAAGIVHLRTWNPGASAMPSERPAVARLARIQARRGNAIATLLHQSLSLGPIERALVPLLDGTRDVGALAEALKKSSSLSQPSIGVGAENATHAVLAALQRLGRRGVLAKAP